MVRRWQASEPVLRLELQEWVSYWEQRLVRLRTQEQQIPALEWERAEPEVVWG